MSDQNEERVIKWIREGSEVGIRCTTRLSRCIHDELRMVAHKYKEFRATGEET
jgi:type I restriction enzyme M protein